MTQWRSPRARSASGRRGVSRIRDATGLAGSWKQLRRSRTSNRCTTCARASGYLDIFCCQLGRPTQGRVRTGTHCSSRSAMITQGGLMHTHIDLPKDTLPLPRHAPQAAKVSGHK